MAKKRNGRQDAIRDIVRNKDVRTQRVLVDELRAMGFDCTQATVSRDIADMGLRKLPEGIYVLAEDLHLQRMVSELVTGVLRTDNLVMIKAQPGTASAVSVNPQSEYDRHIPRLLPDGQLYRHCDTPDKKFLSSPSTWHCRQQRFCRLPLR